MLEITSIAADLMKIFAQRKYNANRYDDTTAIELLKYLQTLAHAEKVPTPKLDQYLAGEYPPVHMGCHIAKFNSLDAQRDAAVNYIASQKSNGWQLINESYDDGGFSGGNTNRPALQRLLQDVRSGKVDIVVVYKIDRLSRSLTDFATLQTEFEKYGVAFCSVTQDINTATSAGRMMLNILMTFAQYEREIIAERIKDKLSASKRKGKYVGGLLPLGYDADSEAMKIIINPAEAESVKLIFSEYVRTSSLKQVQRLLEERNIRTKAWISKKRDRSRRQSHQFGSVAEYDHQSDLYRQTSLSG